MEATTDYLIDRLISSRWSPYSFSNRAVSKDDLRSIFEAARWAASSYNEQPWRYLVAQQSDAAEFDRLLACLVEANQAWAKEASVIAIGLTSLQFERNGKPNKAAIHDLGQASGNLALQAAALGLAVHQMIGILPDKVREEFRVPAGYEPLTALAIGYPGENPNLPEEVRQRDASRRGRKPLAEFVFGPSWGEPYRLAD